MNYKEKILKTTRNEVHILLLSDEIKLQPRSERKAHSLSCSAIWALGRGRLFSQMQTNVISKGLFPRKDDRMNSVLISQMQANRKLGQVFRRTKYSVGPIP